MPAGAGGPGTRAPGRLRAEGGPARAAPAPGRAGQSGPGQSGPGQNGAGPTARCRRTSRPEPRGTAAPSRRSQPAERSIVRRPGPASRGRRAAEQPAGRRARPYSEMIDRQRRRAARARGGRARRRGALRTGRTPRAPSRGWARTSRWSEEPSPGRGRASPALRPDLDWTALTMPRGARRRHRVRSCGAGRRRARRRARPGSPAVAAAACRAGRILALRLERDLAGGERETCRRRAGVRGVDARARPRERPSVRRARRRIEAAFVTTTASVLCRRRVPWAPLSSCADARRGGGRRGRRAAPDRGTNAVPSSAPVTGSAGEAERVDHGERRQTSRGRPAPRAGSHRTGSDAVPTPALERCSEQALPFRPRRTAPGGVGAAASVGGPPAPSPAVRRLHGGAAEGGVRPGPGDPRPAPGRRPRRRARSARRPCGGPPAGRRGKPRPRSSDQACTPRAAARP